MASHPHRRSQPIAGPSPQRRRSPLRWLVDLAVGGRSRRELEARVSSRVGLVARGPAVRPMREYLGLRWSWDRDLRRNLAHCTFCWQEGREREVEVAEGDGGRIVVLTCTDPSHGPAGLRLVRDSGGFRWGELALDCRLVGASPGTQVGPQDPDGGRESQTVPGPPGPEVDLGGTGSLGLPPPSTP